MFWRTPRTIQYAQIFLVIAPAFLQYCYNQAGLSALLDLPDVIRYFPPDRHRQHTWSQGGKEFNYQGSHQWLLAIGSRCWCIVLLRISDALGRQKTIFVAGICAAAGQILQCTAFSLGQFTLGRIILGVGVGQLSVIVPLWQAESSSVGNRGRKVITAGILICVGFVLSSWINLGFSKASLPPLQWRILLAVPVIFSFIICISIFILPQSPRWLVQKHRIAEATEALAQLNGMPSDDEHVQYGICQIRNSLDTGPKVSIKDIFDRNDQNRLLYRFALCLVIQTLQQLNLHLQGDIPAIVAASSLIWKFLCSFVSFFAVDRLERRFPASNHAASIVAAVFIFIFNFCYPIGFLGGNFLYCAEIAPAHLRAAMSSVSTANHWLWNFIITMVTPVALSSIGWKYYIVFAATSACVPLIVLPFFPETMTPTLWDIVPMARRLPQGDVQPNVGAMSEEKDAEGEVARAEQREFA
ncbi:sugar transporter [Aspergillus pseudocaelatus]|uniref:Sugar transporter n=1 Tax=Aspergillus pseudocaelatus TaxID=1825620 RepID=A0ABQ6WY68_9EURO|nr:sugar transporter [Aspergillus pseudocaelatus]